MTEITLHHAERINRAHEAAQAAARSAVEHALEAGRLLIEVKTGLEHGRLGDWITEHCRFSGRTAQSYMRLARELPKLDEANAQRVAGLSLRDAVKALSAPADHVRGTFGTGEFEWYTPDEPLEVARKVLGAFDLDPASCPMAQERVKAGAFYSKDRSGLDHEWHGRVWLNPPYIQPDIALFLAKLVSEFQAGNVAEAIALTHNYTDTGWFHETAQACSAICFTRGRIKFLSPSGERGAPTQGQAFFYFGDNVAAFAEAFSEVGLVVPMHSFKMERRQ